MERNKLKENVDEDNESINDSAYRKKYKKLLENENKEEVFVVVDRSMVENESMKKKDALENTNDKNYQSNKNLKEQNEFNEATKVNYHKNEKNRKKAKKDDNLIEINKRIIEDDHYKKDNKKRYNSKSNGHDNKDETNDYTEEGESGENNDENFNKKTLKKKEIFSKTSIKEKEKKKDSLKRKTSVSPSPVNKKKKKR